MQMTIPRSELKAAIAGFSKIVPNKATLPILGSIKFEFDGKKVTAHATDLDQIAEYAFADAACDTAGTFTAGMSQIKDLAKGSDADRIEFTATGKDKLSVVNPVAGQSVKLDIPAIDPEEWPSQACEVKTHPADNFLKTFQRLAPFASTDETRYTINGCFLNADKEAGKSCVVATDGRRLCVQNSMTLPLKEPCIVRTTKFLSWIKGSCQIGAAKEKQGTTWFGLETGPWKYHVKAIDGTYPNYRQAIPANAGDNKITFVDDISAVRQIFRALPDESKGAIVMSAGQTGTLTVSSKGPNGKDISIELQGSTFTGACKQYALSRNYLLDALNAGFRTFAFADELSPAVSDDGSGGKHVIMPMRVDSPVQAVGPDTAENVEPTVTAATMAESAKAIKPVSEHAAVTKVETITVKQPEMKGKPNMSKQETTAIEKLQAAYDATREKVKVASTAMADLAGLIKDALKEEKQRRSEVEEVRKTIGKIQALKV